MPKRYILARGCRAALGPTFAAATTDWGGSQFVRRNKNVTPYASIFCVDNNLTHPYHLGGPEWTKVEQDAVLRGNAPAKIDDKGRLKVPNGFRSLVQQAWGREVFVTSLTGESVRIYPLPVWQQVEAKLAAMPSTHPSRLRFLDRVNYFGQVGEIDDQGRVLIHGRLRESASMAGEVTVTPESAPPHSSFTERMSAATEKSITTPSRFTDENPAPIV